MLHDYQDYQLHASASATASTSASASLPLLPSNAPLLFRPVLEEANQTTNKHVPSLPFYNSMWNIPMEEIVNLDMLQNEAWTIQSFHFLASFLNPK